MGHALASVEKLHVAQFNPCTSNPLQWGHGLKVWKGQLLLIANLRRFAFT